MLSYTDIKYFKLCVGSENVGKESSVDVTAKCPVCGDGKKKKSKRLHLYEIDGSPVVHCFNGGCEVHNNLFNFIKKYSPQYLESYKKENFNCAISELSQSVTQDMQQTYLTQDSQIETNELNFFEFNDLYEDSTSEQHQNVLECSLRDLRFFELCEDKAVDAVEFLKKRGFDYRTIKDVYGSFYYVDDTFIIDEKFYNLRTSVIIPLYKNSKMYGFYSRNINDKKFSTFMNDNTSFKIWNWFNIDKSAPVYIFEGIFDALSSGKKNVIALLGSSIPQDRLDELELPVFCFDNDIAGKKKALQYSSGKYGIFILPSHIYEKDLNEMLQNGRSSYEISEIINNNIHYGLSAQIRLKID